MSLNPKSGDNYVVNQIGERRDIGMVKWNDFLENENQKNSKSKRKIEKSEREKKNRGNSQSSLLLFD